MIGTRLLTFIGVGIASAEVLGLVAFELWMRDQFVVGFSSDSLWRPVLVLAVAGGLLGLTSHLASKPRNAR